MSDDTFGTSLCALFVELVPVSGASITVFGGAGIQSTICSSNELAARLDELQFDLGEGPRWEAARSGRASVLEHVRENAHSEWPVFGQAAAELGVGALFSFPIRIGTQLLGVADLYRLLPGALDEAETSRALSISHRVATPAADRARRSAESHAADEARAAPALRREVHQATGMVLVQLDISAKEAFGLLQARAFSESRTVEDVARDVVARRLDFREISS
jgi:hypothetical protein